MVGISIQNITKQFGETVAVDNVSLDIVKGDLFFLLGPSGCGKTTILRMIAGFETPTHGEIFFDGRPMLAVPAHKRNTGLVFQSYALWPHMTGAQNVAYGLDERGIPKGEKGDRVAAALKSVHMEGYEKRMSNQLSGGQQQRVALARALVIEPDVVLLDEPLSNLDARLRLQMRHEIRRIHDETGITMVYVTHDQTEALTMGDRIAVMSEGEVRQLAGPGVLYKNPSDRFVAQFIGIPPMNMIDGTILAEGEALLFKGDFCRLELPEAKCELMRPYAGKVVSMGVRPEDVRVSEGKGVAEAVVDVVQPLGPQKFLYLKMGGRDYTARVPVETRASVNDTVAIEFVVEKVHFFDIATDRAII